ncbi:hypothetical protein HW41_07185 [Apilactobacillus kunkeei]|uniref:hypothetical protein n=1 Tax=Apilactobacillus kunkeei TaxID=148814 RepID=UPI00059AE08E|nr:hypothetical protein [Apilactobacillus kunkeei]KIM18269.1 hypothetical protein HW41_07185 [Apilactobacillus kunkeei]
MLNAVLCEGTAEQEIINILLKNDLLKFSASKLLAGKVLRERNGKQFCQKRLNFDFDEKIVIYRILDSTSENFKIPKVYDKKIENTIRIITKPEIEILIIFNEGMYSEFSKSNLKPSSFIKSKGIFKQYKIKSKEFQKEYWGKDNGHSLVKAINLYHNHHSKKNTKGTKDLYYLLK